jgi:glucosamine-6-phosphate deaminase
MISSAARHDLVDHLKIEIHPDRWALGVSAARAAAAYINRTLEKLPIIRIIFACAPSQNGFLSALVDPAIIGVSIDWKRVHVFHMDEYVGLAPDHKQSFRSYLQEHLLNHVPATTRFLLSAESSDLIKASDEYARLIAEQPIDLICLGVGENGHIAFNDPPVADFSDSKLVKVVKLDRRCREQQVNDGCFSKIADVPTHALTLTVPVFRRAKKLSIHVPGSRKALAIKAMLRGEISTECPASILRMHPQAVLYLDRESAAQVDASADRATTRT